MIAEQTPAKGGSRGTITVLTILGLALIALAVFLTRAGDNMFGMLVATDRLGISVSLVSQAMALKRLVFLVSLPVFGLLSDLISRRASLMGGAAIFGMGLLCKAVASAMPLYLAGEIGTAVGAAMVLPPLFALALEACSTQGLLASAAGGVLLIDAVSSHLASLLPSASFFQSGMAATSSWRWSYGLMSGIVLLAAAVGGALLWVSGAMARHRSWPERPVEAPRGWLWVLVLLGLLVTAFLIALASGGTHSVLYYFVRHVLQVDSPSGGGVFLASGLGFAAASLITAPLSDLLEGLPGSRARRSWARPALVVMGLAVICSGSFLLRVSGSLTEARVAMVALGSGYGLMTPSLIALLAVNTKHRWWASVVGLYEATCQLGMTVGSAGLAGMLARVGYVPNTVQAAETISGFRTILSITLGASVLALAAGAASAALHLLSSRSQRK
jgi:MFS family permease